MLTLSQLLETIQEGQIAQATFADETWHIIMLGEVIWYWYPAPEWNGSPALQSETIGDKVALTYSNRKALYTIISGCED